MKPENNWQNKSIETLECLNYGDPAIAPTPLVRKCLEYVKLPVSDLTVEQLRLLIGQAICLPYLIPLALDILDKDILAEGDYYPGDLLKNVLSVDAGFWKHNRDWYDRLRVLIKKGNQRIKQYELKVALPEI